MVKPRGLGHGLIPPDAQPFLSRLSGAGSLRRELEAVMDATSDQTHLQEYRDLIIERNAAGKRSASMRVWTWKRLKVRYLLDPGFAEFRAFRSAIDSARGSGEKGIIELLMMARTDRLYREVTTECISPSLRLPGTAIDDAVVKSAVERIAAAANLLWSPSATDGLASHILSSGKDYGLLQGSAHRRTATVRPGPVSVGFAIRLARLEGLSDRRTLESRWFQLLGLRLESVIDLLHQTARQGALKFRFQADLAEIDLPDAQQASA
jgi:Putative inner membrane protein (DUF1819)